jgi:hypothetical protein
MYFFEALFTKISDAANIENDTPGSAVFRINSFLLMTVFKSF